MPDDIKGIKTVDRPPILPRAAITLRKFACDTNRSVIVTFFNASLFEVFQITYENSTDIYRMYRDIYRKNVYKNLKHLRSLS